MVCCSCVGHRARCRDCYVKLDVKDTKSRDAMTQAKYALIARQRGLLQVTDVKQPKTCEITEQQSGEP